MITDINQVSNLKKNCTYKERRLHNYTQNMQKTFHQSYLPFWPKLSFFTNAFAYKMLLGIFFTLFCFILHCSYRIPVLMSSSLPHLESFAFFRRKTREKGRGYAYRTTAFLAGTACGVEAQVGHKGKELLQSRIRAELLLLPGSTNFLPFGRNCFPAWKRQAFHKSPL